MSKENEVLRKELRGLLNGSHAHVDPHRALEGLDWKLAGTRSKALPHTAFQIVNHMVYWENWTVRWLKGGKPALPKHASGSWPGTLSPRNKADWDKAVRALSKGLKELQSQVQKQNLLATRGKWSILQMLHVIAVHNSYHLGQLVLVRQALGSWPPPSGGETW